MMQRISSILRETDDTKFTHTCAERIFMMGMQHASGREQCHGFISHFMIQPTNDEDIDLLSEMIPCSADNCANMQVQMSGVTKSNTENDGKLDSKPKFLSCGGCRIAKYCSKECQVYDWKHGDHKAVCKSLRNAK
jgi:hypothetical protein